MDERSIVLATGCRIDLVDLGPPVTEGRIGDVILLAIPLCWESPDFLQLAMMFCHSSILLQMLLECEMAEVLSFS